MSGGCVARRCRSRSYCDPCLDWLGAIRPGDHVALNVALVLLDDQCVTTGPLAIDAKALAARLQLPQYAVRNALGRLAGAGLLPRVAVVA